MGELIVVALSVVAKGSALLKDTCVLAGACLLLHAAQAQPAAAQVAVRAGVIYTMAGEPIRDGALVITDGKIIAIGPAAAVTIPEGYEVLEAAFATPGLIDARCTVGVSGIYNEAHDQDQLERSSPVQPELRAIDAYNPQDALVEHVRNFGITTINTGHAPGELVSGQLAIFRTVGNTADEAVIVPRSMVSVTLSPIASKPDAAPGTRAKMVAMLRDELIKAREYRDRLAGDAAGHADADTDNDTDPNADTKPDAAARNLRRETMVDVLEGRVPLLVTANRLQDIQNTLRLLDEFPTMRVILDSASESYLVADELARRKIDVILHPTMARPFGELENKAFSTVGVLQRAGVRVAIQGGFEAYVPKARVVLFEAQIAAAYDVPPQDALAAITIDAARILGIDERVGSLRVGKEGDVALFDADPLEYTSRVVGVVVGGQVVSREAH